MPNWLLSRWLFLRLLGVVYLVAFASLAVQVTGLVGAHGILPAGAMLQWAHSTYGRAAYQLLPTVFWLGSSDAALQLVAWGGAVLSVLLIVGVAPRLVLALLWLFYLSLSVAGQDFLSFQWDALLLETGVLAFLWAPSNWLPAAVERAPAPAVRWLLVFLVFKLMFLSGVTKLLSGDPTWRDATALDYHFWTQPLPAWPGWYAAQLSSGVHRLMTIGMFAIELGAPWLVFTPARWRSLRVIGCVALLLLQVGIAVTGNYGFFNLLAIVLLVPVLDDGVWARVLPRALSRRLVTAPQQPHERTGIVLVSSVILLLSVLSFAREIALTIPRGAGARFFPQAAEQLLELAAPFRSINGYGLFRVMTTERPELVVEGSRDGTHWSEYEFRYKPGPVGRRPQFVAPFHPRLDWQMWFAALDPMGNYGWLQSLLGHLRAGTPEVLALLGRNPFPGAPPRFLRLVQYAYRFSTPAERRRTGAWWVRERVAEAPVGGVAR